jgi:hypothetical protein
MAMRHVSQNKADALQVRPSFAMITTLATDSKHASPKQAFVSVAHLSSMMMVTLVMVSKPATQKQGLKKLERP